MRTLVLNQAYFPHKVVSWEDAITLLYLGKIEVLEEFEEVVRSPSVSLRIPAVVRLKKGASVRYRACKFSKPNVWQRDNYRCQYCGVFHSADKLSYDHVIPRARGGKTVWENVVAACSPCNQRKRNRTPEEAGMPLQRQPFKPKTLPIVPPRIRAEHPKWEFYLNRS